MVAVLVLIGTAYEAWSAFGQTNASAAATARLAPAEARQQQILKEDLDKTGDPDLADRYRAINAKHFAGALPVMPVLWEPRLAEVGALGVRPFTLEGMFGRAGRRTAILLNPALQSDPGARDRALCHEIVHAYLFSIGDTTTNHGPAFQTVLRRLSSEGAFEGILASDEDRQNLRRWLDEESARLDAEREAMENLGAEIRRERADVERAVADDERIMITNSRRGLPADANATDMVRRRDAYNARAEDANARVERDKADIENFNREVARYNLMLVYPDGLDEEAMLKPRPAANSGGTRD